MNNVDQVWKLYTKAKYNLAISKYNQMKLRNFYFFSTSIPYLATVMSVSLLIFNQKAAAENSVLLGCGILVLTISSLGIQYIFHWSENYQSEIIRSAQLRKITSLLETEFYHINVPKGIEPTNFSTDRVAICFQLLEDLIIQAENLPEISLKKRNKIWDEVLDSLYPKTPEA